MSLVQGSEGRPEKVKRERNRGARQRNTVDPRPGSVDGQPPSPSVPAAVPAGSGAGQQEQPPERSGGLTQVKYPLNMETGPTVRVEGTEIVTEP